MTEWTPPADAPTDYVVLSCMQHHAVDGAVELSHRTIADLCGISRTSVLAAANKMIADGVLAKTITGRVATHQIIAPERVSAERTLPNWTPERKAALTSWWPMTFAADLVEPLNALPGATLSVRMIANMADKIGLKHDRAMMGKRSPGAGRKRAPGPTKIDRAPKPLVKTPDAGPVWGPRQTVFQGRPLPIRCANHGCPHPPTSPLKTWCADHAEAMNRPHGEIAAALEALEGRRAA